MIADKPFIFYSLPKSRTTQQLNGGRRVEKAWANVCDFLHYCTTTRPEHPTSISLRVYSAYTGDINPEIADKIIVTTKQLFGAGQTDPITYSYPSGIPDKHTKTEWRIERTDLKKAIDFLINGQPWHKLTFGPIELIISYDFKLIDPATKSELPNQDLSSSIMVWFSRSCICSPDLCFPFDQPNKNFYDYLESINSFLPFKLEHKYLRFGRPNKSKTSYIFNKILTVEQ